MKSKKIIFLVLISTMLGSQAFAGGNLQEDIGCGVGTKIWGSKASYSAVTSGSATNQTSSQIYSIMSGSSGCKGFEGFVLKEKEPAYYAEANYQSLKTQIAQGKGEVLEGFAQTWGCTTSVVPEFNNTVQTKYETIFPSANTPFMDMVRAVKAQIKSNPVLASNCNNIG